MLKPSSLSTTFGLAKLKEEEVNIQNQGITTRSALPNPIYNPKPINSAPVLKLPAPLPRLEPMPPPNPNNLPRRKIFPIKRISPAQMEEMKSRGLCYYCDEKFHVGYKCSRPKLFLLKGLENEDKEKGEDEGSLTVIQNEGPVVKDKEVGELLGISLHALVGSLSPKTMRVEGSIN
ncbi:hypothetical protein I3842_04G006200 [Carya illinoinensis]|uniref:Uncharacterized protein n=1 Tax=Carya illinoinensis TaxID=32201 RepID=A0A922JSS5_CARIL|nr:hypothetical protein I3842_04G006200 [Carya illinoinensis]